MSPIPATTPTYALRYPEGSDPPAGHTQIQNLATDVEDELIRVDADIDTLEADPWVTAGFVAGSGWSLSTVRYRLMGVQVYLHLAIVRTGANLGPGNITDQVILTVPAAIFPASPQTYAFNLFTGVGGAEGYLSSNGQFFIAYINDGAIPTNGAVQAMLSYPLG